MRSEHSACRACKLPVASEAPLAMRPQLLFCAQVLIDPRSGALTLIDLTEARLLSSPPGELDISHATGCVAPR